MRVLTISSNNQSSEIKLEWLLDEWGSCTKHLIHIRDNLINKTYDFGACAGYGLRKVHKFFGDLSIDKAELGFQHPHIMLYDLLRTEDRGFRLRVQDSSEDSDTSISFDQDYIIEEMRQ